MQIYDVNTEYIQSAIDVLESIEIDDEDTLYKNNDNINVPRVTSIISSCTNSDAIVQWANSLGFKHLRYKDELEKASNIGTMTHEAIENYLKSGVEENLIPFKGFLLWLNQLKQYTDIEVIMIEQKLVNSYYGGTCDLLIRVNGKYYIVDYKTSNHIYYKYFLQTSAYRALIYELYHINVDGVIILQLSKSTIGYKEYVLDFSIDEHYYFIENCYRTFLGMLYTYLNTYRTEKLYNELFNSN